MHSLDVLGHQLGVTSGEIRLISRTLAVVGSSLHFEAIGMNGFSNLIMVIVSRPEYKNPKQPDFNASAKRW